MTNIYLIGMRGVGKTTVGKILAEKMQRDFVDMDDEITNQEGKSILEIVEKEGWGYFREREKEVVKKMITLQDTVVSTGGGVLMFHNNAEELKATGTFIFLTAREETMIQRLSDENEKRPALTKKELHDEIAELWESRKETYKKYADITISTDEKTPEELAESILEYVYDR